MKSDLVRMVLQFYSSSFLHKELNHFFILLIPKKENPTAVTDFRLINLFNVSYKVIAKLVVNRLHLIL